MSSKKFFSIILIILLLFVGVFSSAGCGGGGSSSNFAEEPNNPTPSPEPEPIPVPNPDPAPTPEPTPTPTPEPEPPSKFTVTFDSNGGTEVPSQTVESGGTIIMPDTPQKADNIFVGWYTNSEFDNEFLFGEEGNKVTQDITLYAQWISVDMLRVDYALSEIIIGYAKGDNPKYVTQNLTLPTKIDVSGDVNITWNSSNPSIISSTGLVNRPTGSNVDIILTAKAINNTESITRDFSLKVIRMPSRKKEDVEIVPILQVGSKDISVKYTESGDQVTDIEGKYSNIKIENADDALDAIQGIHNELGIENPYDELKTVNITSDISGAEYQFQQVYKGVSVYGYGVMVSANSSGEGDFLHANILSTDILKQLDSSALNLKTSADANQAVKSLYSGNIEVSSADTEFIIFALGEYEDNPVYAYIVNVSGTQENGEYVNETVIINAVSDIIIWKSSNVYEAHHSIQTTKKVNCQNESGDIVSFPIKLSNGYWQMIDDIETPTIEIYSGDVSSGFWLWETDNIVKRKPGEETSGWDSQAVSAYTNMREVMHWWKETFNRNSLDNKGMIVKVIVHQNTRKDKDGSITTDNACWANYNEKIYISDKQVRARSTASTIDVLTHETTHAVLQYVTGIKNWGEESPLRAITEGYADVFACLKDRNWKIAENLSPNYRMRDIESRYTGDFPTEAYVDSVHYVSYAAYLMYKNGLTWDELGKVWYKSMSMSYQSKNLFWTTEKKTLNKESTFDDVRRCLIWAAEKLAEVGEIPYEKLSCVYDALDEVLYHPASLVGTVTDYETGKAISDALVGVEFSSNSYQQNRSEKTDSKGQYSRRLYNEDGKCFVSVNADGYEQAQIYGVDIEASKNNTLDIQLVKKGYSSVTGTIRDESDNSPIANVRVALKIGFNSASGYESAVTTTDENGKYVFDIDEYSIATGHYTVELRKIGYRTTTFNAIVSGNQTVLDGKMSAGTSFRHDISKIDAEIDINAITSGSSGKGWRCSSGILELYENIIYKINGTGIATTNRISISLADDVAVILNNVNIDVSEISLACAFDTTGANVELFLQGENSLKSGSGRAGLEVPDGSNLTISSIHNDDSDSLTAIGHSGNSQGGTGGAGIGGPGGIYNHDMGRAGTIIIYSGKITAIGYDGGAGIGGGDTYGPDGGGLIIIYGGNITAIAEPIAGSSGSGIGSGYVASGKGNYASDDNTRIFILGGVINAEAKGDGAGIGGGYYSDSGIIRILDTIQYSIHATGGDGAQDIGYGKNGNISDVEYVDSNTIENMIEDALSEQETENNYQAMSPSFRTSAIPETGNKAPTIVSNSQNDRNNIDAFEILAVIPDFTPERTDTYTFTVSIDHEIPEESSLILLSNSEDINGTFTEESPMRIKVSAEFTAERTYTPVIVAKHDDKHQSGGCNSGIHGLILLAGITVIFIKKS